MRTSRLRTEWQSLSETEIRRLQARKLRDYLCRVVLPCSARYRALFAAHGLSVDSIRTLEDLARMPFTSKDDLINTPAQPRKYREFILEPDPKTLARWPAVIARALLHGRERVRRECESEFRPIFMMSTTGRSAEPIPFLFTRHDLGNLARNGRRLFEVCGARAEYRLLNLFPYAPHLAFWQTHYGAISFGLFMASSGGGKVLGTDGNLRLARKLKPDVLIGMPTFVYHLLHQAAEEGVRCENLKRIVLGGEKAPAGLRRKLVELALELGAPQIEVIATYGFTEAKMAWAECPFPFDQPAPGYHLYPDAGIVEVIDPRTGEVVPDGHSGELVFTPLDARGSVVLRYRTGDYLEGGLTYEPCPYCGRRTPRLVGRISRRSEIKALHLDKLKGTLVDFNELEHVLDDAPHVGAWQLELRKRNDDPLELDEVILHVQPLNGVEEEALARDLQSRFAARTELHPNRIVFHSAAKLREMQGVGRELKEQRVVDRRPEAAVAEPVMESPDASTSGSPGAPSERPELEEKDEVTL